MAGCSAAEKGLSLEHEQFFLRWSPWLWMYLIVRVLAKQTGIPGLGPRYSQNPWVVAHTHDCDPSTSGGKRIRSWKSSAIKGISVRSHLKTKWERETNSNHNSTNQNANDCPNSTSWNLTLLNLGDPSVFPKRHVEAMSYTHSDGDDPVDVLVPNRSVTLSSISLRSPYMILINQLIILDVEG